MAESKACAVFAWKGESLLEYWQCTAKALIWPDGSGPHMIVDDGGDATMFLMKGREREIIYQETGELVDPMSFTVPEEQAFWTVINATIEKYGTDCFKKLIKDLVGISEETTTGVMRLYQL
jgi:adenosylhomocysteinase